MHRFLTVLALVAGALVPASAALAGAASSGTDPGSIGIRLLDAPADRQDDPRARIYVIDHIDLGGSIERRVELSNTTQETQEIAVYAAGATIANGAFAGSAGHTPNDLSTWTTIDQDAVELGPESTGIVTVSIDVPADAAPGEQYAVVWAEVRSTAPAGGGVTAVNRVGICLYVDVGPGGDSPSAFAISALTASRLPNGEPLVEATVTNTGGRALDLGGTLTLANGPGGLSAGPFDAVLGTTLAPGDVGLVSVQLHDQLPNGPWDARIELVSGLLSGTAEATITFADAGAGVPIAADPVAGFPRWAAVGIGVAVLLLLAILLVLLRRRRTDDHDAPPEALRRPGLDPAAAH